MSGSFVSYIHTHCPLSPNISLPTEMLLALQVPREQTCTIMPGLSFCSLQIIWSLVLECLLEVSIGQALLNFLVANICFMYVWGAHLLWHECRSHTVYSSWASEPDGQIRCVGSDLGSYVNDPHLIFWEKSSQWTFILLFLSRLAGQQASDVCLSCPLPHSTQPWVYMCAISYLTSMWVLGIKTLVLILV